jgi:hypothetical protein
VPSVGGGRLGGAGPGPTRWGSRGDRRTRRSSSRFNPHAGRAAAGRTARPRRDHARVASSRFGRQRRAGPQPLFSLGAPGPAAATRALRHVTTRTALHTHIPAHPELFRAALRITLAAPAGNGGDWPGGAACGLPLLPAPRATVAAFNWACVGGTSRSGESSWCSIRRVSRHLRRERSRCATVARTAPTRVTATRAPQPTPRRRDQTTPTPATRQHTEEPPPDRAPRPRRLTRRHGLQRTGLCRRRRGRRNPLPSTTDRCDRSGIHPGHPRPAPASRPTLIACPAKRLPNQTPRVLRRASMIGAVQPQPGRESKPTLQTLQIKSRVTAAPRNTSVRAFPRVSSYRQRGTLRCKSNRTSPRAALDPACAYDATRAPFLR